MPVLASNNRSARLGVPIRPTSSMPPTGFSRVLALPLSLGLVLLLFAGVARTHAVLSLSALAAGGSVIVWTGILALAARRTGRGLAIDVAVHKHHWVQACAQVAVLLYLGWYVPFVVAFLPLIAAQLVFAYGVDSLLAWSRRGRYALGFGPFPVVLSINLFLWFRPEWFFLQFLMVAVGYLAKEFIRWDRAGRSAHIFNPSSFPLAAFSLALLLSGTTDITLGRELASAYSLPPNVYLVIFLAALPGQILFGVARMTLPAVATMFVISEVYVQATGTFLFYDAHIPPPVFLGMHLLLTDPSTSPRSPAGRVGFGVAYGIGTTLFFILLTALGAPTFYDKLLPLPLMNLMVRWIDRLSATRPIAAVDRLDAGLPRVHGDLAFTAAWALVFVGTVAAGRIGERHPGQFLPFWEGACVKGSARACDYAVLRRSIYCLRGSGWACNEWGAALMERARPATNAFRRGCALGFAPACDNAGGAARSGELVRSAPELRDLPIILSGTGRTLPDLPPAELYLVACTQGWSGACPEEVRPDR